MRFSLDNMFLRELTGRHCHVCYEALYILLSEDTQNIYSASILGGLFVYIVQLSRAGGVTLFGWWSLGLPLSQPSPLRCSAFHNLLTLNSYQEWMASASAATTSAVEQYLSFVPL
jgi:hypothetical protein